jgi:hypothetical protein
MSSPSKAALLLRDTYQLYARMLAAEKITVVFDEAIKAPANFDILNRILRISPLHAAQEHLVPGLTIHEVGHALFSHLTEEEAKRIKRISKMLNILDDGYQERMTCKKYPNAKKELYKVFDHFFIQGNHNFNTGNDLLDIVNVLNYNCKGFKHGKFLPYPAVVQPDDLKLLHEGEQLNIHAMIGRWEFSKKLSKALRKYGEMPDEGEDFDFGKDKKEGEGEGDSDDESEGTGENGNIANPGGEGDDLDDLLDPFEDDLIDHHKAFQHQMGGQTSVELVAGDELMKLATIRELYDLESIGCKLVFTALANSLNSQVADRQKAHFIEAKKVANQIFTKFNMRVQAKNFAQMQYKNTGMLDPERAALYQVYDDVFMKQAIDQNQVNHAYTIVLDWSGSMSGSVVPLTLRILELVFFAQSTGIEIDVWLYTTGGWPIKAEVHRNVLYEPSSFYHILNTKQCGAKELDLRMKMFWMLAQERGSGGIKLKKVPEGEPSQYFNNFALSGTNVFEGFLLGQYMLSKMQADRKTCFLLTDGEDGYDFGTHWDAAKKGLSSTTTSGAYVNGIRLDSLYPNDPGERIRACHAVADLYRSIGQKTVGIAWNCSGSGVSKYADAMILARSGSPKVKGDKATPEVEGYTYGDNVFVDEIVKNLL